MQSSKFESGARILLAIMLAVFGADKFFHYLPMPDPPEAGGAFLGALTETGYIFPTIGVVFLLSALLLMTRRVVLALLLVAPIAVNILLYHVEYDMAGIGAGALLSVLLVMLAFLHGRDVGKLFGSGTPAK